MGSLLPLQVHRDDSSEKGNADPWLGRTGFPDRVHGLSSNFVSGLVAPATPSEPIPTFITQFSKAFVPWLLEAADTISSRDHNSGGIV